MTGFDNEQRAVAVTEKKALGYSWRKDRACVEKLGSGVEFGRFLFSSLETSLFFGERLKSS